MFIFSGVRATKLCCLDIFFSSQLEGTSEDKLMLCRLADAATLLAFEKWEQHKYINRILFYYL